MKKFLTAIVSSLFLLSPTTGFAAYVIHLKDGTNFVTDQYVEEGDQIKFKRYGGLIGVEKDRVSEIEQIEDLPEVKAVPNETEAPTAKQKTGKQEALQDEGKGEGTQQEGATEAEKNKQKAKESEKRVGQEEAAVKNDAKKDPKIMAEFKALEQRFESRKNMFINELIELKNALTALRDTIISNYSEEDYRVEINKIADMRFFLTDLILRKPKNQ